MKKILMFLMVVSVSLTFLVFSIERNAYNEDYYIRKYEEHDIEELTQKSLEELKPITNNLILYLKGGENDLLRPHFNEKEILHMEDVKELFNLARIIKYTGIIIIILGVYYFRKNKNMVLLAKTFLYGLFLNYILLTIIGFLAYKDFNKYFTYFHLIFFTNDLWILDPNRDLMIQMLPEEFFIGMATNIVISFLVYLAILQIVSYLYIRKDKIKNETVIRKS
ncbi:TIGR01906 family membrane protein [Tissierella creatinophila]|uniref:Integral membrane protein n=1 Tax=Tissierella creatinophila DSM 6911 TaxID=1123403 RepID=A0A1U7M6L2_TISCR|nr:TIGR01906 family membrane protein [Tissierella creatinophila]OLS02849.1 hypothetical protein TICRE_11220 [Tissierella creatinophila DSM 6911]